MSTLGTLFLKTLRNVLFVVRQNLLVAKCVRRAATNHTRLAYTRTEFFDILYKVLCRTSRVYRGSPSSSLSILVKFVG